MTKNSQVKKKKKQQQQQPQHVAKDEFDGFG